MRQSQVVSFKESIFRITTVLLSYVSWWAGRIVEEIECLEFLLTAEVSFSITGAFNLVRLPFVSTGWPERTGFHRCKWKGQGRSAQILTRSLRGINTRADVNNMADFTTKLSNVRPKFPREILSSEDTLFLNLEDGLYFFFFIYSPGKEAKIADYLELTVPRYQYDVLGSHLRLTSSAFELLSNFVTSRKYIHLVGHPLNKENRSR